MRQSEGKKTEKRLSAAPRTQVRAILDEESRVTIVGPAAAMAAPPARIRSSILLKTASSSPRGHRNTADSLLCYFSSIAVTGPLGNVPIGLRRRLDREHPRNFRRAFPHRSEDHPVVPPETLPAAHRLHQEKWENIAFGQRPTARAETYFTAAVSAPIGLGKRRIGRISHRFAPQNEVLTKGDNRLALFYTKG